MKTVQVPFQAGSPMIISGPTGSGKTVWTYRLLKDNLFTQRVSSVLYCYGVYQSFFDHFNIPNLKFQQGLPSKERIEALNDGNFHIVILDDLMEQIIKSSEAQDLFTKHCHHFNISAIFITQNIFAQGKYARTINLNTHILVLFANKRDESQAVFLGRQLFPFHLNHFLEVYQDATAENHGYIVIDCDPKSSRQLKLRTKIFKGEQTIVYVFNTS
jgi:hypothetical protein